MVCFLRLNKTGFMFSTAPLFCARPSIEHPIEHVGAQVIKEQLETFRISIHRLICSLRPSHASIFDSMSTVGGPRRPRLRNGHGV